MNPWKLKIIYDMVIVSIEVAIGFGRIIRRIIKLMPYYRLIQKTPAAITDRVKCVVLLHCPRKPVKQQSNWYIQKISCKVVDVI
jgi:hypothetical protein